MIGCTAIRLAMYVFLQQLAIQSLAQSMSSPYSAYGIGDIDHRNYHLNAGMGYTGIASKTTVFTNGNNPASSAGIEKSFLILNLGTAARIAGYHGDPIDLTNTSNRDFTIKTFSIAAKITDFWASGIGLKQFTNVSYQFKSIKSIEGSDKKYNITYSGDGGLNEYYWNNSFSIGKHVMAGVTGSIIAGPINQTETLVDATGTNIESKRRDYYGSGKLSYGIIYATSLSKSWQASIGARYAAKTKLDFERTISVTENGNELVEDQYIDYEKFSLPQSFGGGITLSNKKGVTVAADYCFDEWAAMAVKGDKWQLVNSSRMSAGVEFAGFKQSALGSIQRSSFQFGGFLNKSYLVVNKQQIKEWGVTAGITRSLKGGLMIGASVEGGVRGTTISGLIKENYFQFTVNFSYRDFINSRGQKYK
jgi:hypothetical protein